MKLESTQRTYVADEYIDYNGERFGVCIASEDPVPPSQLPTRFPGPDVDHAELPALYPILLDDDGHPYDSDSIPKDLQADLESLCSPFHVYQRDRQREPDCI